MDFTVAGALEFFEDHFVHSAASVDQRSGDDGQRAAFFHIARGAEKSLGPLQGVGVHTTSQHLARRGHDVVVGAGQAGDGVKQDDDVFFSVQPGAWRVR